MRKRGRSRFRELLTFRRAPEAPAFRSAGDPVIHGTRLVDLRSKSWNVHASDRRPACRSNAGSDRRQYANRSARTFMSLAPIARVESPTAAHPPSNYSKRKLSAAGARFAEVAAPPRNARLPLVNSNPAEAPLLTRSRIGTSSALTRQHNSACASASRVASGWSRPATWWVGRVEGAAAGTMRKREHG